MGKVMGPSPLAPNNEPLLQCRSQSGIHHFVKTIKLNLIIILLNIYYSQFAWLIQIKEKISP